MPALTVRAAQPDDLDLVVELRLALLREYRAHPLYAGLRHDARQRARELYHSQLTSAFETIFLAEHGGRVSGLLRCVDSVGSPLLLPERFCYISSVYVRPENRRTGVLRALMAAAEQWCEQRHLDEIRLHSATASPVAEQAWSSLGFEVVEQVRRRALHAGAR
jgi:GNAT superfamily N-acetyltransferase